MYRSPPGECILRAEDLCSQNMHHSPEISHQTKRMLSAGGRCLLNAAGSSFVGLQKIRTI